MMNKPDPVEYINTPEITGWVFWDETWTYPSAAYGTEEEARAALQEYGKMLYNADETIVQDVLILLSGYDGFYDRETETGNATELANLIDEAVDMLKCLPFLGTTVKNEAFLSTALTKRLMDDNDTFLKELGKEETQYRSSSYNNAKKSMQNIVELPNGKLNSFIRCCLANNGALADKERIRFFPELTTDEVLRMEKVVTRAYKGIDR